MTSSLLQGIANPQIADIGGRFRQGTERRETRETQEVSNQIASDIVRNQIGFKFGELAFKGKNPAGAVNLAKALGIPTNDKDRMLNAAATVKYTHGLLQGGADPKAVGQLILEQAQQMGRAGIDVTQMTELGTDLISGDPAKIQAQTAALAQLDAGLGGAPKTQRVKASEVINGFVIETDGQGNFTKTKVSEATVDPALELKREELDLKILERKENLEAKKIKAAENLVQKDAKAVANAFEAQTAIENLDELLKDDAYKAIYGTLDQFIPTLRADSVTLESIRDQVVDLLGLESRQKLKGQGTISDSESKALARSSTILGNPGITEAAAFKEINRVRDIFKRGLERSLKNKEARRSFAESLQENLPADTVATQTPEIVQKKAKVNFKFLGFEG